MTTEKVRVAFLGAGKQANWRHYPSLKSQPDVDLVALCDMDEAKAIETAKRWDVPKAYTSFKRMLAESDPQAVYIIMGPDAVQEPVTFALKQGRNVFVEK